MKYQWLFLNVLDSVGTVERLVAFYVVAYNVEIPHAAYRVQTPDEIYYGRGEAIPGQIEAARTVARAARQRANRELLCAICAPQAAEPMRTPAVA